MAKADIAFTWTPDKATETTVKIVEGFEKYPALDRLDFLADCRNVIDKLYKQASKDFSRGK